ncbi:biotin synthase BioB [Brooklawnia cerclae]|uniref:Biotin synthase n=1 Tax=Brooklawnia cerclae TaxID=349934 RepID=A0ABX0SK80_9ACTN|nr:biotin synthase BioB [Brooklawnia cerclae]NIH57101.1 biotin synthase [Brooklawnia cerclae]
MSWNGLAERIVHGGAITREEALGLLGSDDDELLAVLDGAFRLRRHYFGRRVRLNVIFSARGGRCGEDCGYCSQSVFASSEVEEFSMVDEQAIVEAAHAARASRAGTYCIVMSGRRASRVDVDRICGAVRRVKAELPGMKICVSLGLIDSAKSEALADAGVDRFNHNVNTSRRFTPQIVTTHQYEDRLRTVETIKKAGLSPCSGVICGMGETDDDLVDVAFDLARIGPDSIPINFLIPVEGTRLAGLHELTPVRCLRIAAMFRFVNPSAEIRLAGGRELNLGSLQPLALFAANSLFLGDYLTSEGQAKELDLQMIRDLGFTIEDDPSTAGEPDQVVKVHADRMPVGS